MIFYSRKFVTLLKKEAFFHYKGELRDLELRKIVFINFP